jgi:uncharacterized surface protein with fasciclin (FAS1) repeats
MKQFFRLLTLGALAAGAAACSSSASSSPVSPSAVAESSAEDLKPGSLTIVGIVLQPDGEFDVLQAAVVRAGFVDALNGTTQYTVFAPTDAAFVTTLGVANEAAAIDAVNQLDLDTLRNILLFHITNGRRNSNSVLAAPSYVMLNGSKLTGEQLSAAGLGAVDVSASNGIVHVINHVLMP